MSNSSRRQHERGGGAGQRAFTDLFQRCRLASFPKGDFLRVGDVTSAVDRAIGRVTLRLVGSVPTANSVRLPKRLEDSLGAAGRFLYIQLRLAPGKPYALHADATAADRGLHRLTISNLHAGREEARMKRSGVQVFLPAEHDAWTLLAIDLQALTRQASRSPHARLHALQLCANMQVRAAFTSHVKYNWQSLPEDLLFTATFDVSQARVQWVPQEPEGADVAAAQPQRRPTSPKPAVAVGLAGPCKSTATGPPADAPSASSSVKQLQLQLPPLAQPHWVSAFCGGRPGLLHWVPATGGCGAASTSEGTSDSSSSSDAQDEIVFAAGSLIVAMQPVASGSQRYLQGHTRPVQSLARSSDGSRLASAEEGSGAAIRLWDFRQGRCLASVPGHAGGLTCLDLSSDGCLLVTAGVDAQGRQELACWDVSACWASAAGTAAERTGRSVGSTPVELARQVTDHNIQAVKWVPPSRTAAGAPGPHPQLVTSGKNSVRLIRLKDGQLCGASVPMDGVQKAVRRPYSCGTLAADASCSLGGVGGVGEVFTCLAWERPPEGQPVLSPPRLLAGTLSGAVYVINADERVVEGVAQLHSGAVAALAAHGDFVASGSTDRLLRVWGCDLQQAALEAQHEGPVTGVALCPSGMRMAVGTDTGALSLLDICSGTYVTLLRSHTSGVTAVALMGQGPGQEAKQGQQYCTAGRDGSVRVWEGGSHKQLVELTAPGEEVLSLDCHPSKEEVACGFQSGVLRVWDVGSTLLLHESRQHTGAVAQVAFARHGRLLLSLGEDGCVAAYDAQRNYMPTAFLVAGFPLHASCMVVSADGRLLAMAGLSMTATNVQPTSGRKGSAGRAAAKRAQPVIVLLDTLTLQPKLQFVVAGSSPVVQLQLLPDARHVLAATADGRLRSYSCGNGSLVLDVPRCLPSPTLCSTMDPSGNYFVAGSADGKLTVLGLHALHAAAATAGENSASAEQLDGVAIDQPLLGSASSSDVGTTTRIITALPAQAVTSPSGTAVLGAVFADAGRQLLTAGDGGEVCCWAFDGAAYNRTSTGSPEAVQAAIPVQMEHAAAGNGTTRDQPVASAQVQDIGERPALRPVFNIVADGTSAAQAHRCASAEADALGEAPHSLPAAIRCCLRTRPPSARLERCAAAALCPAAATGASPQQASASLLATPLGRQSSRRERVVPFWVRQGQPPEASLLISTACGKRCAQVVRGEHRLVVTSASKGGAAGGRARRQRSAAWVESEFAADRTPSYRPEQQLQLLPPSAAVQRIYAFEAAAGFGWMPAAKEAPVGRKRPGEAQPKQFVFAAGNVLVAEDLAAGAGQPAGQRHLARLPGRITGLALSSASQLAAAAVESGPTGGSADIHLVDVEAGEVLAVLPHHSYTVTALAFSTDGRLLASLGNSGGIGSSSLAFWEVGPAGCELAAGVQMPGPVAALAWCMSGEQAVLYTAGAQGLTHWQLSQDDLLSTAVHLPAALRGVPLTAVAWAQGEEESVARGTRWRPGSQGDAVLVGDSSGRAWLLDVDEGQDVRHWQLLVGQPGQPVSCLRAEGALVVVGSANGTLQLLKSEAGADQPIAWKSLCCEQLDGSIVSAQLDAGSHAAAAATSNGTLWQVAPGQQPRVLLCGQAQPMRSWQLALGAAWEGKHAAIALASAAGISVWQLLVGQTTVSRAPLVEFGMSADATHACLAEDCSVCAAAYADGSICMFDVREASMRWRVACAERQGHIAALAVVQRLRGCKVLVAYSSGAVYLLDGGSGKTALRIMQFAVQQDSGRLSASAFPLAGLTICPTDTALFALTGEQDVVVCRAHFLKNAEVRTLARLSFGPPDRPANGAGTAPAGMAQTATAAAAVRVAFSRCHPGHLYCTDTSSPGALLLLDYTSQAILKTVVAPLADRSSTITALALSPDESLLAAGTSAGTVLLQRLQTEAWVELAAHAAGMPVKGLAFSSCGARLWSAAGTATFEWEVQQ